MERADSRCAWFAPFSGAGLSDNHEMTLKDVGRLVEELGGVQEVVPLIEKAFQTGMPEAKKDQGAGNL